MSLSEELKGLNLACGSVEWNLSACEMAEDRTGDEEGDVNIREPSPKSH